MSVLQLFFAILVVLSISIIFMLVVLVFQLKIGSRIMNLRSDLEKTNLEFSLLKKGRMALQKAARPIAAIEASCPLDAPLSQQTIEEDGIKIVRNVRGTFTEAQAFPPDSSGYGDDPAATKNDYPQTRAPRQPMSDPFISMYDIDETKQWFQNGSVPLTSQMPPAVGRPAQEQFQPMEAIPLFSPSAQGPDFAMLYSALMEFLATRSDRAIAFDFAGIQFLNDQELDYLETLHATLFNQDRMLIFLRCGDQITGLLRRRPRLAESIR